MMITTIKKYLLVSLVLAMSMVSGIVWAGGAVNAGNSRPLWITIWHEKTWSTLGE